MSASATSNLAAPVATVAPSAVPPMLLLSETAVARALSMAETIHINGQAFLAAHIAATDAAATAASNAVAAPAQTQVPAYASIAVASASKPEVKDVTLFKPALLEQALGCKVVAVRPVSYPQAENTHGGASCCALRSRVQLTFVCCLLLFRTTLMRICPPFLL